jgi:hypothetical protein
LSEIGNLIVSKNFLISQLGYLISMMDCPEALMKTMQEDLDRFIFRTGKNPWMAKDRRYLPPNEGGMGAINITKKGKPKTQGHTSNAYMHFAHCQSF